MGAVALVKVLANLSRLCCVDPHLSAAASPLFATVAPEPMLMIFGSIMHAGCLPDGRAKIHIWTDENTLAMPDGVFQAS